MSRTWFLQVVLVLFWGCAGTAIKWRDWEKLPREHYTIPPYAKYLKGLKIALDPGHGGMSHLPGYKRGPSGKREAVMNLNVALYLKQFLEAAGAEVVMTREDDRFVSIKERVEIAEQAGCDILISIHHNFSSNPKTNFPAVFYHQHPDSSPVSLDLARNIYFGLVDALHLPDLSEEGLLSDSYIYPAGFGLLRRSKIPAVLLESSFYSNPDEEKRLMKRWYNRREAYGIFLGLARWAAGGIPGARLVEPASRIVHTKRPRIVYELDDGLWERHRRPDRPLLIYSESISLKIDSLKVPAVVDMRRRRLIYQPDSALTNGLHVLQVDLQNMFKNHNFPRLDTLIVAPPVDSIHFITDFDRLPADGVALVPIRFLAFDADGEPVWDGTEIQLQAEKGSVFPKKVKASQPGLFFYQAPEGNANTDRIVAAAGGFTDTLEMSLVPPGTMWLLAGIVVDDSTEQAIAGAEVILADSIRTVTDEKGSFRLMNPPVGPQKLVMHADGYHKVEKEVVIDSVQSVLVSSRLKAVFGGLLHGKRLILDAALGGSRKGDLFDNGFTGAVANLELVRALADRLTWAGAHADLVRDRDMELPVPARIKLVNGLAEGIYLKLAYRYWNSDSVAVAATIYPANREAEQMARAIFSAFSHFHAVRTNLYQNDEVPEVRNTNKTAIELVIWCRAPEIQRRDMPAIFAGIVKYFKRKMTDAHEEINQ